MTARKVRGEQPLPIDVQGAEKVAESKDMRSFGWDSYLALSILRRADGSTVVVRTRLDPATRRVVPEVLDTFDAILGQQLTNEEVLRHWAQELALRSLEDRW